MKCYNENGVGHFIEKANVYDWLRILRSRVDTTEGRVDGSEGRTGTLESRDQEGTLHQKTGSGKQRAGLVH